VVKSLSFTAGILAGGSDAYFISYGGILVIGRCAINQRKAYKGTQHILSD
jgi:hypothetical protein